MPKLPKPDPLAALKVAANKRYKSAQARKRKGKTTTPRKPRRKVIVPPEDTISTLTDEELKVVYDEIIIDRELGERSLRDYARMCWPKIEPGIPYIEDAWHSDCLSDHFQALVTGDIRKLLVSIAPGSGKSSWAAIMLPTFAWISRPYWKMAFGSYSYDLTRRDAAKCIKLLKSTWWRRRWGHKFDLTKVDLRNVQNSMGGIRAGVSVSGQTLGIRADLVVADDPLNILEVDSEIARANVQFWWENGMRSRGDKDQRELVILQRLHSGDLIGYLQHELGGYETLTIPAEYDPKRHCVTFTTDGTKFWEDPRKREGELMFPQKFPKSYLDSRRGKDDKSRLMFQAMYQQDPIQAGGNIIKKHWFRYYSESPEEAYQKCSRAILSCDLAVKSKLTSTYTVIQIWGIALPKICLIDQYRRRLSFVGEIAAIKQMLEKWNNAKGPGVSAKLIEDKASGPDVIDVLKDKIQGIIPFPADDNKEERMSAITWLWEAGNIYVPGKQKEGGGIDFSHVPWMDEWFDEITRYPKSRFNDQAITMSQALVYINRLMKTMVGTPSMVEGKGNIYELQQKSRRRFGGAW